MQRLSSPCVASAMSEADLTPIVETGRNCWRVERASKARMIVDAADYYALLARLMEGAKERILLIGWAFDPRIRSEEHTSALQSLMRISYAVFCLHKKNKIFT